MSDCDLPQFFDVRFDAMRTFGLLFHVGVGDHHRDIGIYSIASRVAYVLMKCLFFDIGDHANPHGEEAHESSLIDSMTKLEFCNKALIKLLTLEWLADCLEKFKGETIEHLL